MTRIAIVDDDISVLYGLSRSLASAGFDVAAFSDGRAALSHIAAHPTDLAVLDISMPGLDGIGLMAALHRIADLPVIFLTARTDELDEILGLQLGAEDYVPKPCSGRLLAERIRTVLRRRAPPGPEGEDRVLIRGPLHLDSRRHCVTWNGADIALTVTEFLLLRGLAEHPGFVRTRAQLMDDCYDMSIHVDDRTIDTHVKRLRGKFRAVDPGFAAICTIYGVGYKFVAEA